jgi:hypothetical protein
VVDNFTGCPVTNFRLVCHFINSHPSVLQDDVTDSLNVFISNELGQASCSFLKFDAYATNFEHFTVRVTSVHRSRTLIIVPPSETLTSYC